MKKIEKYVVFKYEDEFGFHYMEMDKLPGEGPTYMEPVSFEKKINPNCTPGLSPTSRFQRTANRLVCSAPNSSPWRVGGPIKQTSGNGRNEPGFTEPSRS